MRKSLNDVRVGDRITAMGDKVFTSTLEVAKVDHSDGSVVGIYMATGQFWLPQPGQALVTTIECVGGDDRGGVAAA